MIALRSRIAGLHPAHFAMVMATGIVSVAAHLSGMRPIGAALLWPNVGFYVGLWLLYLARLRLHPDRFLADLKDHNRGVGFFTIVAGTCVLGTQLVVIRGDTRAAFALWILGTLLWLVLTYTIFTGLTVKPEKPSLADGLNGGWLLAVVAAQSVSSLGSLLARSLPAHRDEVLFFTTVMWLGGGMLYIWIISLIFYRYTFFPLTPAGLAAPYWINMGAMAISTLAGATLVADAPLSPLLRDLLPFLKGFTLLFWATATWWIPMLLILGVWRHVSMHFPLVYDVTYWGAVFPLGMYTVCTYRLAESLKVPFLFVIPRFFVYVALAAWLATGLGLVRSLLWPRPTPGRTGPPRGLPEAMIGQEANGRPGPSEMEAGRPTAGL
jgi:tellurite resistance protein TehA-like permease